jgi:MoxR-like ATPase
LARCFGGEFARIQFTPDLMPSDVTGHAVYDMQTEQFKLRKGPLFTNHAAGRRDQPRPGEDPSAHCSKRCRSVR